MLDQIARLLGPDAEFLRGEAGLGAYRTDKSGLVGRLPLAVVRPASVQDVQAVCRVVHQAALDGLQPPVAIVPRGGGTGLSGGAVPVGPSIVLDMTTLDRIGPAVPDTGLVHCQAGVTIDRLNRLYASEGLFFPVMPTGAGETATVGGVISTNARGMYAMKYGSAGDNVCSLDCVLSDGRLVRLGHDVRESSSGLNLAPLLVGAEGTLAVIVAATVRLHPRPVSEASVFLAFDDPGDAARACAVLRRASPAIAALELVSRGTVELINRVIPDSGFPRGKTVLMLSVHSDSWSDTQVDTSWLDLLDDPGHSPVTRWSPDRAQAPWEARHRFTGVISEMSDEGRPVRLDPAVGLENLGGYVDWLERAASDLGGHERICIFGHAGVGLLHILLATGAPPLWPRETAEAFRRAAIKHAIELGGTVTGEHGVGMAAIDLSAIENAPSMNLMSTIKHTLDPTGIMNPGKVLCG
ncbi:MAG TPA: FAD-binding oxidoreductase [Myxococcota bacterium]|nr:FAD-binding oxidoreductase [Myxococcota bacterium]